MTFNFGVPAPAAAAPPLSMASTSGFTFGGMAAAPTTNASGASPAPEAGVQLGLTPVTATNASSSTRNLFGANARAPTISGLFGAPPATAPGTTSSGAATAQLSTSGIFSNTSTIAAPVPTTGERLGVSTTAPATKTIDTKTATANGILSSFSTPATSTTSLFGANILTPKPSSFGTAEINQASEDTLARFMSYSSIPPHQKNIIDSVYQAIMNHKTTILAVSSMAPKTLDMSSQQDGIVAGEGSANLPFTIAKLEAKVLGLEQQTKCLYESVTNTKHMYESTTTQAMCNAKWQTGFVAQRIGVNIAKEPRNLLNSSNPTQLVSEKEKEKEFLRQLNSLMANEMNQTDIVNRMPSPYLWRCLEQMKEQYLLLEKELEYLRSCLEISKEVSTEEFDIIDILKLQEKTIYKIAHYIGTINSKVNHIRNQYSRHEKGTSVLVRAGEEETRHEQQINQHIRSMMLKSLPSTVPPAPSGETALSKSLNVASAPSAFGAPAPTTSFGLLTPVASIGGLFGNTTPATTPIPAFGNATTIGSNLFGPSAPVATTLHVPTPSTSMFGTAPTPSSGSLFGNTAPTPAPTNSLIPKSKRNTRASSRRR